MGTPPSKEVRKRYYQKNKEKILQATAKRYQDNPEKYMEYQREYRKSNRQLITDKQKAKRREKVQALVDFLGGCCSSCKQVFPLCVYDFHHTNPQDKEFTIGEHMGKAMNKLKQEAEKCILLCSNCHRITHDC